jgi:glycine/serine hydroxymethyltransferase
MQHGNFDYSREQKKTNSQLELIASENFVSDEVMEATDLY